MRRRSAAADTSPIRLRVARLRQRSQARREKGRTRRTRLVPPVLFAAFYAVPLTLIAFALSGDSDVRFLLFTAAGMACLLWLELIRRSG
jgi:hypothetical protein